MPTDEVISEVVDANPVPFTPLSTHSASVVGARSGGAPPRTAWMIDSGATNHMQITRSGFTTYAPTPSDVTIANGESLHAPGHGSVTLSTSLGGVVTLGHALYVLGITVNLLSVRAMAKRGNVTFEGDTVTIEQDGRVVALGRVDDNDQYMFEGATINPTAMSARAPRPVVPPAAVPSAAVAYGKVGLVGHLWHRRMGHLGNADVAKLAKLVTGMTLQASEVKAVEGAPCVPCVEARMTHRPHDTDHTETVKLEKLHVDLFGPLDPSEGGVVHFMSALDDNTEMGFATPLKWKADAGRALQDWIKHLELQTGLKVKTLRCNGAGELVGRADMQAFFKRTGLKVETSAPYTPQMNGKAERLNRTIVERLRAVLLEYRLDKALWAEILMALFFLRNRSPSSDGTTTSYERFYGSKPDVSHFKVLGSTAYAFQPRGSTSKLAARTLLGTVVGYAAGGHALRIRSSATGKILVRRDVVADETLPSTPVSPSALPVCLYLPEHWSDSASTGSLSGDDGGDVGVPGPADVPGDMLRKDEPAASGIDAPTATESSPQDQGDDGPVTSSDMATAAAPAAGHDYFLRHRAASDKSSSAAMVATGVPSPASLLPMTVDEGIARPNWNAAHPKTRAEALTCPDAFLWQEAMDSEMDGLRAAKAWELMELPRGAMVTGGRLVFAYKRDADGTVMR